MANKRYGSLVAIRHIGTGNNGAIWECLCDCGNLKDMQGYLLRRGSVKTCGCRININDNLTGKKFGRLKVLKEGGRHKDRSILWECSCVCGNTLRIKARNLRSGETKSCGCLRRLEYKKAAINRIYRGYKNNSKIRKVCFELDIKEFTRLTSGNCYYCGIKPSKVSKIRYGHGNYHYNGIDRKDNSLGYTKKNCVPCCFVCNRAKNNLEHDEFIGWVRKIAKKWSKIVI